MVSPPIAGPLIGDLSGIPFDADAAFGLHQCRDDCNINCRSGIITRYIFSAICTAENRMPSFVVTRRFCDRFFNGICAKNKY
jgi:hypothetical protein